MPCVENKMREALRAGHHRRRTEQTYCRRVKTIPVRSVMKTGEWGRTGTNYAVQQWVGVPNVPIISLACRLKGEAHNVDSETDNGPRRD